MSELAYPPWRALGSEPSLLNVDDLRGLAKWAHENDFSDFCLSSSYQINGRIHGQWITLSNRKLSTMEISMLCDTIFMSTASSLLKSGRDLDFAWEVRIDIPTERGKSSRFRVNATSVVDHLNPSIDGIDVTFRRISEVPPELSTICDDQGLLDAFHRVRKQNGLVMLGGNVGTGKTTLISGMIRKILADKSRKRVITYEAPVEQLLGRSPDIKGFVVQVDIGRNLRTTKEQGNDWHEAGRNSLRRAADVVFFAEVRDAPTMTGLLEAAVSGQLIFTTLHVNSVAEVISRCLQLVPIERLGQTRNDLMSSVSLVVHQRLLRGVDGGRVAVREYLEFTQEIRDRLRVVPTDELSGEIAKLVALHGQSLVQSAQKELTLGKISQYVFDALHDEFFGIGAI